jgi:hypothetical protein
MKAVALAAACCLLCITFAAQALGRSPSVEIGLITNRQPSGFEKRIKARVAADGPFVPGQPASISIRRMPKRALMFVSIQPIQSTPACENILCVPTFVVPDESNPTSGRLARVNGHGRAEVTFTMPASFQAITFSPSGKASKEPQEISWQNNQAVQVTVAGARLNHRGDQITGVAGTKTLVQVPPPAPPS